MARKTINEIVSVTALGFRKNLTAYPRRMEYRGVTYDFIDAGVRLAIKQGESLSEVFTLSDGQSNYCLKNNRNDGQWTLVGIW